MLTKMSYHDSIDFGIYNKRKVTKVGFLMTRYEVNRKKDLV